MKLDTILVATDFSEYADVAVAQATAIARTADAEVVAMYAFEASPASSYAVAGEGGTAAMIADWIAAERKRRKEKLYELESDIKKQGVRARTLFVEGYADEVVVKQADELGADLIVIGSHGRTGMSRWLLGSVAEHVVRRSRVPVLIARGDAKPFRKMLVPTDFTPFARRALDAAITVAEPDSQIDLIHFWQDPLTSPIYFETPTPADVSDAVRDSIETSVRKQGQQLVDDIADNKHAVTFDTLPDTARHGIQQKLDENGYDLVVLGSHGHRGLKRFFLGSVAETTVRHAKCSVLVAHAEQTS